MSTHRIPLRGEVAKGDKWDLSTLYADEAAWEKGLKEYEAMILRIEEFRGTLGESARSLKNCLSFMTELEKLDERLGSYAHLRVSENEESSEAQGRSSRYMAVAARAAAAGSYQTPEIQRIPDERMAEFLANPLLKEYRIFLEKLLRFRPHILSEKEEKLLALQTEANQTARRSFSALTNGDMEFGTIETSEGAIPLTQSTFFLFLFNPNREIRKKAYFQFYRGFEEA